ncbi:MAG: hypothetical protein CL926_09430 [Deltaproteobacteria bacterium]|mgnify:FL=1|nr:hypothetical protein [Deltaproteobacteria bacterium]
MPLIPLKIPAGFHRTGTDLDAAGRWRDGSLVRWRDGSLRPIGGWRVNENIASITTNAPRGMHTWESNNGTRYVAAGSYNELFAVVSGGTAYDIAPTDLTAGSESASVNIGYGYGFYGVGAYGTPRPDTGNLSPATTWSLDNWGEYLLACSTADGRILEWQLGTSSKAAVVANAPTNNLGIIVTEERFVFALGAGGNPRKVAFSDREDNTTWTPASTNEAGDIELQTSGQIETAIRTRGQTLILTDVDAHTARYIGPPYVYSFQRVGTSCGIISRRAAADVDMGVFWMGNGGFFRFDGNVVSEIPCAVHDYVFGDLNTSQKSKTWAFTNGQFGEIWWFYCSGSSTEIDRYVAFDYKENHWLIGSLSRTSGASRGVFEYPMLMGQDGAMFDHEVGLSYVDTQTYTVTVASVGGGNRFILDGSNYPAITLKRGYTYVFDQSDGSNSGHPLAFRNASDASYTSGVTTTGTAGSSGAKTTFVVPSDAPASLKYYCTVHGNGMGNNITVIDADGVFAESGPFSMGSGDKIMQVTDLIPDEKTQGDVNIKFKSRFYPNATESTHGPFTPANPTAVRFSGRQIRMRIEGDTPYAAWRVGTMRIDAKAGGRR